MQKIIRKKSVPPLQNSNAASATFDFDFDSKVLLCGR